MALLGDNDDFVKLVNIGLFMSWSGMGAALVRSQYYSEVKPQPLWCSHKAPFLSLSSHWKDTNGVVICSGVKSG